MRTCADVGYLLPFQVLTPLRSTVMPRLLARLEQMPDYSIFRGYIIVSFHILFRIEAVLCFVCIWSGVRLSVVTLMCFLCVSQQQYGLANEIEAANTYTVFAPNNDAIENYLRDKKSATLVRITHKTYLNNSVSHLSFKWKD